MQSFSWSTPISHPKRFERLFILVRGVVQGVGFRPFVYQIAHEHGLNGWVRNDADTVRIEVQGTREGLDAFVRALRAKHPPQARIDSMEIREIPGQREGDVAVQGAKAFVIRASGSEAIPRPTIPADLATCEECLAEIRDPAQRRFRYPFTNCTNCGPRWSIIERLPYDRPRTSMAGFTMCADCRAEYENPGDRRFHAQPIACPRCGPTLRLLDSHGHEKARGDAALTETVEAILQGKIVALQGLGGFQLLVDATHDEAVARLRQRKRRPDRPLAVMLPTLEDAQRYCIVSEKETRALISHQAPIVLLKKIAGNQCKTANGGSAIHHSLSAIVAPGNPYLGVMLPYTPLHHLLTQSIARPIVCTSGNLSEEPMAITVEDALERLGLIADVFLTHNRPIVRPVDDSIARMGPSGMQVMRRARGFAPLPIGIRVDAQKTPTILALGGHLKNTVALALGGDGKTAPTDVVLSSHVGDLDSVLSVEVFRRAAEDLLDFFQCSPEAVVCDLHPDYASTQYAEQLSARYDVPLLRVQHHHAHVAACMVEHGLHEPVVGFSWDGTGYGLDSTVWGGEVLFCSGETFQRAAHLRTFPLPGGDRAAREPRRSALGVLWEIFGPEAAEYAKKWFSTNEISTLFSALHRRINTPRTSSMGRLFDAVAALCGLAPVTSFEGQAAMALEFAVDENEKEAYVFSLQKEASSVDPAKPVVIDWEPVIQAVLADRIAGVPVGHISAKFHQALIAMAVDLLGLLQTSCRLPVVLSGGCFQNAVLANGLHARLSEAGFQVYTHSFVPPGDGGIALGQVFLAMQQLRGWFDVSGNPR